MASRGRLRSTLTSAFRACKLCVGSSEPIAQHGNTQASMRSRSTCSVSRFRLAENVEGFNERPFSHSCQSGRKVWQGRLPWERSGPGNSSESFVRGRLPSSVGQIRTKQEDPLFNCCGSKSGLHPASTSLPASRRSLSSSSADGKNPSEPPSPVKQALEEGYEERTFEYIQADVIEDGAVGLITLSRPKSLNALSEGTMWEVLDALTVFDQIPSVGAMVITGEGKAFAAGADIKEMMNKNFVEAYTSDLLGGWETLGNIRKPVIAAVDGYALGGGCEVAMMCDIILAGERAVFGQPEVKLGVIPGMGGTQRLVRAVGKARAMEMILTGEAFLNAEEAVQAGLASRLVKGEQGAVLAEAVAVAKKIARYSRPAVMMAKEAVNAAFESNLREGLRRERSLFHAAFGLEDKAEGMKAFEEKRIPAFRNK